MDSVGNALYAKGIEEVMNYAKTDRTGLTASEAAARLERDGKNALEGAKKIPGWVRFVKQLKHIMMIVLFVAMILTAITSILDPPNQKWIGVGLIALIILVNAGIGYFQENQAEKSVEALKKATKPFARVLRGGEVTSVKTEDLVVGDVVLLEAGDIVPADMRLIETASLMVEEAALTGESVPVEKSTDAIVGEDLALGDMKNIAFMSGIITYGRGRGVIVATGMKTQLGIIAGHLAREKTPETPLTISLNKTMRIITAIAGLIAAFIFVMRALSGDSFIDSMLITVAIAVCAIPEAIPICVSVTMSLGVQRMSKRKAIVRNLPAIETLGSTQIICSDKTGTITLNKMTVTAVYPQVDTREGDRERMRECMILCNDTHAKYADDGELETIGDPTEAALVHYGYTFGLKKDEVEQKNPRRDELPFDSARKMMSTVNETPDGLIMYTKGAFEIIKMRCTQILDHGKIRPMTDADMARLNGEATGFAKEALRVLGYAYKPFEAGKKLTPEEENDLIFIGFSGLIDPPREEVIHSVEVCKGAGIMTKMITGDHRDTAYAIAKQVGIADDESQVVTGAELQKMSDAELAENVMNYRVYARVNPEDKLRIVKSLKSLDKIVAMTGDGVNDAPSIKAADIGIGMGISGTEVTKGAADVILTDDNFATIESAVEEGRRTYSNILKIVVYLISLSIAEIVLLTTLIAVFGLPFFNPLLILWVNVVTDTLPAIALGSLPAELDIMRQRPNATRGSLFRGTTGVTILVHSVFQSLVVFAVYFVAMNVFNWEPIIAITMSYVVLGTVETVHPFNLIHYKKSVFKSKPFQSRALNWAVLSTVVLVVGSLVLPLPAFQHALGITRISLSQWGIAVAAGIAIMPMIEIYKVFKRRYYAKLEQKGPDRRVV
ncbi:MAG: cation-translocating P-type ATPase [Oscillospiraceae bacterium]|nr:cation-translocating P-type ATPase [Oscillospiraceae bacterium]